MKYESETCLTVVRTERPFLYGSGSAWEHHINWSCSKGSYTPYIHIHCLSLVNTPIYSHQLVLFSPPYLSNVEPVVRSKGNQVNPMASCVHWHVRVSYISTYFTCNPDDDCTLVQVCQNCAMPVDVSSLNKNSSGSLPICWAVWSRRTPSFGRIPPHLYTCMYTQSKRRVFIHVCMVTMRELIYQPSTQLYSHC